MTWVFEKQAERFTRLKNALVTVAILIIAILVFFIGTILILGIANAQPKGSPLGFWLGLLTIPYFFVVVCGAAYSWQAAQRRLLKTLPAPGNRGYRENTPTKGLTKDTVISSDKNALDERYK